MFLIPYLHSQISMKKLLSFVYLLCIYDNEKNYMEKTYMNNNK